MSEADSKEKRGNKMRGIRISKIVLNMGCATKIPVENAKTILGCISGTKVVITKTKKRSTFNVPKGKPIGCMVTIRNRPLADAKHRIALEEFLKRLLAAKENKLKMSNFDDTGNFSFGIPEYIDISGMEYDPKIGMLGLDVSVALERPGYRTGRKKIKSKIGKRHKISINDAVMFVKNKFDVKIEE